MSENLDILKNLKIWKFWILKMLNFKKLPKIWKLSKKLKIFQKIGKIKKKLEKFQKVGNFTKKLEAIKIAVNMPNY